ncbi:hypothetical protein LEN26_010025 [Aphanomyces euteiches]|nr:hypothetical protein AeMF1_012715 [Aphanomyces euteiches]KAH9123068.1 hypothetical protein LEN26_010025 [Aphanomyces euteiches]KAH9190837.1 hypothetical protein AeNC1_007185 [Aphanomyces euteiches]
MLSLICVVVGEGTPFVVDIEADQFVDHLQDKIKAKKSNTNHCDAYKLELYLALKGNAWLSDVDPDLAGLSNDADGNTVLSNYINDENKMLATRKLNKYIHDSNRPKESQIHVLVVVPPESKKRKRQELGWLDFHDLSPIVHLENLPPVDNLRELLLQPLPFQLKLTDSALADRIFDMNSEQKESQVLQTPLNFLCV